MGYTFLERVKNTFYILLAQSIHFFQKTSRTFLNDEACHALPEPRIEFKFELVTER